MASPITRSASPPARVPSPHEYLESHHLPLYLNDVVALLLRLRPAQPLEFIANYFEEVLNGTHVLLRDFEFISQCPRNRWAFILVIQDSFASLGSTQEVAGADLLQLLRLFCPDFPPELVLDACKLCGDSRGSFELSELLHCWRARFYYAEFLERTAEVFETCDTRASGRVNRNVLCMTLRQTLTTSSRLSYSCPPTAVFDDLLVEKDERDVDIRLIAMQRLLVDTPLVRSTLACRPEGRKPLVASPTPSTDRARQSAALGRLLDEMKETDRLHASMTERLGVGGDRHRRRNASGSDRRSANSRRHSSSSSMTATGSRRSL